MAKYGSHRGFFLSGCAVAFLTASVAQMDWHKPNPSASTPSKLSLRLQGEQAGLVQLEAPLDEVDLESAPALAEEKDGSGWIDSGDPASIPLLIRYLRTHDELAQLGALAEFAGMGAKAKKAVPAIVLALQDPKSTIRVAAAVTLIQMNIQTKTAIKALAKELRSADAKLREPAAGAVDQLVNPPPEMNFSCWGPDPPPLIARPWVRKAIQQALNH